MEAEYYYEEPELVYQCRGCGEEYETRKEAINCCATWMCGYCGEEYETKAEAEKCCSQSNLDLGD